MKRKLLLIALASMIALAFGSCDLLFPPDDVVEDPHGPVFTGSITNSGTSGIAGVKVGVFHEDGSGKFSEELGVANVDGNGKITPTAALSPIKTGTVSGATYSLTFPVFENLSQVSGNTWNMVAWNDANNDGKLDTAEANAMATVNANPDSTTAKDYFFADVTYSTGYKFKYYAVDGDGTSATEVDPATVTSTSGFNFIMNF